MHEFADIFSIVITAITPITVAILGYLQNKKIKNDEAYRKLRDEKEELEAKQKKENEEKNAKKLNTMEESIGNLAKDVETLREEVEIEKIKNQLNHLHMLNEFNFEYIQSLSKVVITMGETISSSELIDNDAKLRLQSAVDTHNNIDSKLRKDMYKILK